MSAREVLACLIGGPLFALAVFGWLWALPLIVELLP